MLPVYNITDKESIVALFFSKLRDVNEQLTSELASIQHDLGAESKSTAGDKHETGRAMIQLEMEQLIQKINQLAAKESYAKRIDFSIKNNVCEGAFIVTESHLLLIAEAIGSIEYKMHQIQCISVKAPMIAQNLGKRKGDQIQFNQRQFIIQQLL